MIHYPWRVRLKAQAATCLSNDRVHYIPFLRPALYGLPENGAKRDTCASVGASEGGKTESRAAGQAAAEIDIGKFQGEVEGLFVPLPLLREPGIMVCMTGRSPPSGVIYMRPSLLAISTQGQMRAAASQPDSQTMMKAPGTHL